MAWDKEKKREYDQAYREANREKRREYDQAYREANREKIREKKWVYREANREKIREKGRTYCRANREKKREYDQAHYQANQEKIREKVRAYREANQEKIRADKRAYSEANREKLAVKRVRKRAKSRGLPFDLSESDIVFPEFCPCCGASMSSGGNSTRDSPSVDRLVPRLGYVKQNIVVVCLRCNTIKNDATPKELYRVADFFYKLIKDRGLDARVQDREEVP